MISSGKRNSGVTLLEVILALVILSLTVVGAMQASSQCLAVSNRVRHFDAARRTLDAGNLMYPINSTNEVDLLDENRWRSDSRGTCIVVTLSRMRRMNIRFRLLRARPAERHVTRVVI